MRTMRQQGIEHTASVPRARARSVSGRFMLRRYKIARLGKSILNN
jgi:hypothetical protein